MIKIKYRKINLNKIIKYKNIDFFAYMVRKTFPTHSVSDIRISQVMMAGIQFLILISIF